MFKIISYTFLTVLTVDLLATSGDITATWTSPIFPKLNSNDLDVNPFGEPITSDEESWIGSLMTIGAMIGPLPYGFIAGKFGRKVALLAIAIPHIVSYLTFAYAKTVYLYYFARILGGIAVGGGYTILPMYVAEIAEDSNRGMLSATLNVFWTFGNLIPYVIGPYTPIVWFNIILACIPTTFFVLFLMLAPETPFYLVSKNKVSEGKRVLMLLRSGNKKAVDLEIAQIKTELEKNKESGRFLDLFKSKVYVKGLIISLVLIMASQLSGINAVLFNTQEIFAAAGAQNLPPEISSIIIGVVTFVSSFMPPLLADRAGRRILLMVSCFGVVVSLFLFGLFFYFKQHASFDVSSISWLPLLSLILYIMTFTIGLGPLPWTISSELFPTSVKSSAAAVVSFVCWMTSFFVTKFFNNLNDSLGKEGTFWLFGGFCLAALIFTFFFVPETKGKSFQEIQEILKS